MWHEARRREKATQKLFTEHRKRAEKRREENRAGSSNFLQVNGIKSKIQLDLNTHKQAAKSLVVWQGDQKTTIDRFDVRATLSSLPKEDARAQGQRESGGRGPKSRSTVLDADESDAMRKLLNFERFRLLVQNDLNKMSEGTRLRLVGGSEFQSQAMMKKLENNWFGTSGETSSQTAQTRLQPPHSQSQQQQQRSLGVSIGFNYSQGPPLLPTSSLSAPKDESSAASTSETESQLKNVIDLDESSGKFDLDDVEKSLLDSKQNEEILSKYGLTPEEFHLLIESDVNPTNLREILDQLRDLRSKRISMIIAARKKQEGSSQASYGPELPPEMLKADANHNVVDPKRAKKSPSNDGESVDSPVGQRSPSGATIPLRSHDNERPKDSDTPKERSPMLERRDDGTRRPVQLAETRLSQGAQVQMRDDTNGHSRKVENGGDRTSTARTVTNQALDEPDGEQIGDDAQTRSRRTRRAPTPLAYKRYRRSSRSLSRERHSSNRHRGHTRDRSRYNPRSRPRSRSRSSRESSEESSGSSYSSTSSLDSSSPSSASSSSASRSRSRSRERGRGRGRNRDRDRDRDRSRSRSPMHRRHRSRTSPASERHDGGTRHHVEHESTSKNRKRRRR